MRWIAQPVILDAAKAFVANHGAAKILSGIAFGWLRALNQFVDRDAERACGKFARLKSSQHSLTALAMSFLTVPLLMTPKGSRSVPPTAI
jgi:hypothetical protein